MSAAKHTPGPWSRDTSGGTNGDIRGVNGRWVALTRLHWNAATRTGQQAAEGEDRANAEYIVQCVNAHDKLVHFIEHWTHEGHLQTFEDRERFRAAARQLIAKATGNFDQGTGFLPPNLERAVNQRSESRGKK
jgi:hypothetical protein